jgi:ATP-dependent Clp protease ATP-binding subunit ClpC
LEAGHSWREIAAAWEAEEESFRRRRAEFLLYPWGALESESASLASAGRFTDRARKAIQLANQEAHRANGQVIGTEHLLLGLLKEGFGTAALVLKSRGLDLKELRRRVEETVPSGPPTVIVMGRLPSTPLVKKVIEHAIEEARNLGAPHTCVCTEHLLLSLLREREGVAVQVLAMMGHSAEDVRSDVHESVRGRSSGP